MKPNTQIDFRSIRSHRRGQEGGFEELIRQLIIANPPDKYTKIENRGSGPDGGVEVLVWLENGDCIGWQAKYFIDEFSSSQIQQIKDSFYTALERYPTLTDYYVAIPRNLSGDTQGSKKTQRKKWEDFCLDTKEKLDEKNRNVKLHLWDESQLISFLSQSDAIHTGIRYYWFNNQQFSIDWFEEKLKPTLADLGERYTSDLNVDVSIQSEIDIVQRNEKFLEIIDTNKNSLAEAVTAIDDLNIRSLSADEFDKNKDYVLSKIKNVSKEFNKINWIDDTKISSLGYIKTTCLDLRRSEELGVIRDAAFDLQNKDKLNNEESNDRDQLWSTITKIHEFFNHLEELDKANLLEQPLLLISGKAGSGKSHLLAYSAKSHTSKQLPAVLLLGEHLNGADPRQAILYRLGLPNITFQELLGTLQAAALAAGRPALIMIDAINDSAPPNTWKKNLAGISEEILSYDRLALIISCRSNYKEYCVPKQWTGMEITHYGFEGNEEEAANLILDKNGITRPSAPLLNPEFSNPLFLTTVVKSLKRKGQTAFPTGLHGITSIFQFWIESIEEILISKGYSGIIPGDGRILKSLERFAEELTLEKSETLALSKAHQIFNGKDPIENIENPQNTLLQQLINEGVLRKEPAFDNKTERVAFTFQRFSDHFIANNILKIFDSPEALARAIKLDGEFAYLFEKKNWKFLGIIEALYIQVPEKFGVELPLIEKEISNKVHLPIREFINSLTWREPTATSVKTSDLFETLFMSDKISEKDFFDTLIRLSALPGHALYAKYLHEYLLSKNLHERDRSWSLYLCGDDISNKVINSLIDWAWQANTNNVKIERAELVAIVLCWSLSTSNRVVRDKATKALTTLFYRHPNLALTILADFSEVNDPYIIERILASICGAFLHLRNSETVHQNVSIQIFNMIFNNTPCTNHAYIRRYARSIIDSAISRYGAIENIKLEKVHPPYLSKKIEVWPTSQELLKSKEFAPRIFSSVVGYYREENNRFEMPGDFGRYTMSGVPHQFSKEIRSENPPKFPKEIKEEFWKEIEALGNNEKTLADDIRYKKKNLATLEWLRRINERDELHEQKTVAEEESSFKNAEEALLKLLPENLKNQFLALSPYSENNDDQLPMFCLRQAQIWVAARAIEIGHFNNENTEPKDSDISWGRMEHSIERLGKKYQWIALFELIGYLMDYHWHIDWKIEITAQETPDYFSTTDIDPSYIDVNVPNIKDEISLPNVALPEMRFETESLDETIEWTSTLNDIPNIPDFVELRSEDHNKWWIVDAYYRDQKYYQKLKSEDIIKTSQWWIEFSIVRSEDLGKIYNLVKNKNLLGNTIANREEDCRTRLFGEYQPGLNCFGIEPWLNSEYEKIPVGSILQSHKAIREQYDYSGESGASFQVPSQRLIEALNLYPENPRSRKFLNPQNEIVFADLFPRSFENSYAVFRADILNDCLKAKGFSPIWFLKGEKDGGQGRGESLSWDSNFKRQGFCGMWWLDGTEWRGTNWLIQSD